MRFQLWGNSRVHISLFEPVEMPHQCRRAWDVIGVDIDDHEMIDSFLVGGSSRFLHKKHGLATPSSELKEIVHNPPTATTNDVSDPIAEIDDTSFSPEYQSVIDEPIDTTLPAVAVLGLI